VDEMPGKDKEYIWQPRVTTDAAADRWPWARGTSKLEQGKPSPPSATRYAGGANQRGIRGREELDEVRQGMARERRARIGFALVSTSRHPFAAGYTNEEFKTVHTGTCAYTFGSLYCKRLGLRLSFIFVCRILCVPEYR